MLEEGSESSESRLSVLDLRLNLSRRDVRRWVSVVVDPVVVVVELVGAVVPVVPVVPIGPVPVDVVLFGALPTVREPSRSESTVGNQWKEIIVVRISRRLTSWISLVGKVRLVGPGSRICGTDRAGGAGRRPSGAGSACRGRRLRGDVVMITRARSLTECGGLTLESIVFLLTPSESTAFSLEF